MNTTTTQHGEGRRGGTGRDASGRVSSVDDDVGLPSRAGLIDVQESGGARRD